MNTNIKISSVFNKLADYEELKDREFPMRTFRRYAKIIYYMTSWRIDDDGRIIVTTNYGDTKLGQSSSIIFSELINNGFSSRLIEYERNYGILNKKKTDDKRISYESASQLVNYINNELMIKKLTNNIQFDSYVTGSYRREKSTIGDLDFIVVNFDENKRTDIINIFLSLYDKILVHGDKKVAGIIKSVQVDVRFIENRQFPCMLLHSTGSAEHNIKLRKIAKSKGYRLNEYCITEEETGIELYPESEKEIFEFLGVPYLDPKDR